MSPKNPVFVHHRGHSTGFLKELRGVLGDHLKLQEIQSFFLSKNSSAALQNPGRRRTFRKKRSLRLESSLLDGPSTSGLVLAAVTLQLLREDNLSWKEEKLVSAFPHKYNVTQELEPLEEEIEKDQRKRCREENFPEEKVRAVNKIRRSLYPVLKNLSPKLPQNFKIHIEKHTQVEPLFVFEKTLSTTDVNRTQNRLLIPVKQVKNEFLTMEEKDEISGKGSIDALLIQPSLTECKINLRKWNMGGKSNGKVTENYVLVTTWNKVVKDNNLKEEMRVQLWSYRRGHQLCFALVKKEE